MISSVLNSTPNREDEVAPTVKGTSGEPAPKTAERPSEVIPFRPKGRKTR